MNDNFKMDRMTIDDIGGTASCVTAHLDEWHRNYQPPDRNTTWDEAHYLVRSGGERNMTSRTPPSPKLVQLLRADVNFTILPYSKLSKTLLH